MTPLNRDILKLAVPSILANITVPLVGMVDLAVAGHLDGNAASLIGGVTIGTMLFDLLYWNFGFLRVGTGGLTAQAYGRGDFAEDGAILVRGVSLSLLIAAVILLIQWPFLRLVLYLTPCSEPVRMLAEEYFFIRIWAAPATLSLMALKGWFIGMQDSVSSMATDLLVNTVNIGASIGLSMGIHAGPLQWDGLGFKGIAYGTLLAQYSGFLFALLRVAFKYGRKAFPGFSVSFIRQAFEGGQLRRFASVNTDLFIRSVALVLVYVGFTMISATFGDLLLSSGSIMMKLLLLFSYFTDGFAYAGEALTGKYIGMGDREMTRRTVHAIFVWSLTIGLSFVAVYELAGVPILRLLTSDAAVVETCRQFFAWLLPMPLVGCLAFTWDGVYVGATASRAMRNATLWSVVAFFGTWFLVEALIGESRDVTAMHVLLGAYFAHLGARAVYQSITYRRCILEEPFAGTSRS